MTIMLHAVHLCFNRFESKLERLMAHHRCIAFVILFVGAPMLSLTALFAGATLAALPFALLFGWL